MPNLTLDPKKDYPLIPAESYVAVLVKTIDLGTHTNEYEGKEDISRQMYFQFETPDDTYEMDNEKKPYLVGMYLSLKLSEKSTFRRIIETWLNQPFDNKILASQGFNPSSLLGKPGFITVSHKVSTSSGNTYPKITSITALPKSFTVPTPTSDLVDFDLDNFNPEVYEHSVPEFLKEIIRKSPEFQKLKYADNQAE